MTDEEARAIAREAAREAVHETFIQLGFDTADPTAVQRDSQFLRDLRLGTEAVKRQGLVTVVGVVITAALAWIGLTLFKPGGAP